MLDLSLIKTIVFVMLENHSFDHMLGHLSYRNYANGTEVDGLTPPLNKQEYENLYEGETYYPFIMKDGKLSSDLPHERDEIEVELGKSAVTGELEMNGFVKAYFQKTLLNRTFKPDPVGFLTPRDVPITNFFAYNFAVCDRWFSSLPASTQPNRLMALTGNTLIDSTSGILPPTDRLLIDWLSDHNIRWRVYHCGISFFALLGHIEIFGSNFRPIERLAPDFYKESENDFPEVIIIEPSYGDAPHIGNDIPNDNHPPLAVSAGEVFLKQIYEAVTCNPDRWNHTVMILTYDEHGGFFDHVKPPALLFKPSANAKFSRQFDTLGVRVPSIIISPFVIAKTVFNKLMDHTSILQFIAEKFIPGQGSFSDRVEERKKLGITSVSEVLNLSVPRSDIPVAPNPPSLTIKSFPEPRTINSPLQDAFENAAQYMVEYKPKETAQKYPDISHWVLTSKK